MKQAILFPFSTSDDNEDRYIAARNLAKVQQVPLLFFTTVPQESEDNIIDTIYLYLLKLKGTYQAMTNTWREKAPAGTKMIIKKGDLAKQVQLFVATSSLELTIYS